MQNGIGETAEVYNKTPIQTHSGNQRRRHFLQYTVIMWVSRRDKVRFKKNKTKEIF